MKTTQLIITLAAATLAGAQMVAAQSFDCKLARTSIEKTVCSSKELSAADSALAAKYKQVLSEVPAELQAEVRTDQRRWLKSLNTQCGQAAAANLSSCVQNSYAEQKRALDGRVKTINGVKFVTRSLQLLAKDDKDDPWKDSPELEENPGYGTLDASWPQAVDYPADQAAAWKAWNAAVLDQAQRRAGDGSDKPAQGWQTSSALGTDATLTASLQRVGSQVVTTSIGEDGMGHGAAHPFEDSENFHWLLKQQRELQVADVFTAGSPWEKVVAARCRASLREQIGDDFQSYAEGVTGGFSKVLHEIIINPRNWEIDAKGLTIDFPEYSVSPRAEPVDGVTVPWAALRAYLVRGFDVPK